VSRKAISGSALPGGVGRGGRVDGVGDRGAGLSATPATGPIGVDGVGDRMGFGSMA
jgi:hypothetical protein